MTFVFDVSCLARDLLSLMAMLLGGFDFLKIRRGICRTGILDLLSVVP